METLVTFSNPHKPSVSPSANTMDTMDTVVTYLELTGLSTGHLEIPYEQHGDMFLFLTLEDLVTIGFRCIKFFPSVKLKNSYVDRKFRQSLKGIGGLVVNG